MVSNKTLERLIGKRVREYGEFKSIRGMSQVEIIDMASKLKRERMSPEKINEIGVNAETHFREVLKFRNIGLFNLYVQLKAKEIEGEDAKNGWARIEEGIDEKAIKKDYINSRISTSYDEIELINEAIGEITTRVYCERFRLLKKGIGDKPARFVLDLESRINQVNYPNYFNEKLFSMFKGGTPLEFIYLLCLRYKHENGKFGVSSNLEPFSFRDIKGNLQRRDGSSKRFQLDTVMDLKVASSGIDSISHKVIVMDTDLNNFLVANSSHRTQAEEYIQSIRNYVEDTLDVIPASQYFEDLGFDESEYKELVDTLNKKDGSLFSDEEYSKLLEKNANKISRTLKWGNPKNEFYTASSIARNLLVGKVLSQGRCSRFLSIFNKNASIGSQFNVRSQSPVILMALPIYGDNVGSIEYA